MAILKNSIVRKIGLAIFLFVMIMFFSYYLFLNMQIKKHLEQQGKEHLMNESQYLCSEIVAFLQKYVVIVEQAKNNRDFIVFSKEVEDRSIKREHPLFAVVTKQLDEICDLDENISQAYLALASASDIITSDYYYEISPDYDLSVRQWYKNTIEENKTSITTPYIDLITNKTAISFTTPLMYEDELLGAFGIDILVEDLNQIMSDYNSKTKSDIGLIYKNGQILYNSGLNDTTDPIDMFIQDILSEEEASKLLSGDDGIETYNFNGEQKYIAYLPVDNTSLIVYTNILKSDLTSQVQKFMYINLSILLGLLVVITGFLFVLEKVLSRPLINISREVESYSNNNSISLPEKYINRSDEIGILSKGIAFMLNNISDYILKLEEMNRALHEAKEVINRDR
ncbi:MAG: hypothetical protein GX025_05780, partial [Clostridiales bacterium]|nr:hypothetical protein [Clostridiales bacterium]